MIKKIATAFSMAWGNFLTLPCPYKAWDSELKNMMLALLPLIGAVIGGIWVVIGRVSLLIFGSNTATALIMTFLLFALCGFMHMDGFMDVNDAVMSRRELAERQRILKDSTVGAFAVVTSIFLVLGIFAFLNVYIDGKEHLTEILPVFVIPVMSRAFAGGSVLMCRPLGISQYSKAHSVAQKGSFAVLAVLSAVILAVTLIIGRTDVYGIIIPAAATATVTFVSGAYARAKLGGMNGDIAGYSICMGELFGVISLLFI